MSQRMDTENREQFLNQLAQRLGRERRRTAPEPLKLAHHCHRDIGAADTQADRLNRLESYAESSLGVAVYRATAADLTTILKQACDRYLAQSQLSGVVLSGDERLQQRLDLTQLDAQLSLYTWQPDMPLVNREMAEKAAIGVVWGEQLLAESGTVVLYSSAQQGRSISLLPETSIFVVAASTLGARLTQGTDQLHRKAAAGERMPSCVNLISGPSSTADIELIKVVGVHGPVHACYIVIEDL